MSKTVNRILLYLDEYHHTRNDFTGPLAVTQAEMARALGVDRAHLSRVMGKMEEEGVVFSERKHVETRKKRVKVYYLTDTGRKEVDKIRGGGSARKRIEFTDDRPKIWYFYGRGPEMEEFKEWSSSSKSKILVVKGIAGIGKTCFISKAIDRHMEDMNLFWYRFNEWSSVRHLLMKMASYFSKLGKRKLEWYIDSRENIDIGEVSLLLEEDLEKINTVLVFDDYQKVDKKEIKELMGCFVSLLPRLRSVKLIVAGREVPRFYYDVRDVAFSKSIVEMNLQGLDKDSSSKMLKVEKVDETQHDKIFQITRGHPLALTLFKAGGDITSSSIAEYLGDEIVAQLSSEEKTVLEVAASFRLPAKPTAYLDIAAERFERTEGIDKRIEYEVVDSLSKKSMFYISKDGYNMHDLLKDLFYSRIPRKIRNEYHQLIADHYLKDKSSTPLEIAEALYHMVMAGNYPHAAEIIADKGKELLYEGYGQEALDTLEDMPLDDVSKEDRPWLSLFHAEVIQYRGDTEKAIPEYLRAIELFKLVGEEKGEMEACLGLADIYTKKDSREEALAYLDRGLSLSEKNNFEDFLGEAYKGLGEVLKMSGDLDEALVDLERASMQAKKTNNSRLLANVHMSIAGLMTIKGDYDQAIESSNKGIKILEDCGSKYEIARAYNVLGILYNMTGEFDSSKKPFAKAVELAEESGNMRYMSITLSNAAECHAHQGDLDLALEYCDKAHEINQRLKEEFLIANNLMAYGIVYHKKEEWKLSEKKFIESLKAFQSDVHYLKAQVYTQYARMLVDAGKNKESKKQYMNAIKIHEKFGSDDRIKSVKEEMSN